MFGFGWFVAVVVGWKNNQNLATKFDAFLTGASERDRYTSVLGKMETEENGSDREAENEHWKIQLGSGCGSVVRAVSSDTRDPRFESSHWKLCTILKLLRKDENKEKVAGTDPIFNTGRCTPN